jgi:hypothetical protein
MEVVVHDPCLPLTGLTLRSEQSLEDGGAYRIVTLAKRLSPESCQYSVELEISSSSIKMQVVRLTILFDLGKSGALIRSKLLIT